jgi:hypothetical protein
MRGDRKPYEPRGLPLVGKSETEIEEALMDAFSEGFDAGVEEAQRQFIQTQLLFITPAGNA